MTLRQLADQLHHCFLYDYYRRDSSFKKNQHDPDVFHVTFQYSKECCITLVVYRSNGGVVEMGMYFHRPSAMDFTVSAWHETIPVNPRQPDLVAVESDFALAGMRKRSNSFYLRTAVGGLASKELARLVMTIAPIARNHLHE
jgi:hypothetical protein